MEEDALTRVSIDHNVPRISLALGHMTDDDYHNTYWPRLRTAVDRLLEGPPVHSHAGPPIEFEPMYSAAYKCVCQQHSESLYNDLTSHLHTHFLHLAAQLQNASGDEVIDKSYYVLHHAMYSLDGIIPIFTYLNRVYVIPKLSSNLRTELQNLFCSTVVDPILDEVIGKVRENTEMRPLATAPHVLASLVKNLYKLNPSYAHRYPKVFARYVPGVLPAMKENELSTYISETQELQASLRQAWVPATSQGVKRSHDEEITT